jgi:hypothetical protein
LRDFTGTEARVCTESCVYTEPYVLTRRREGEGDPARRVSFDVPFEVTGKTGGTGGRGHEG